MNEWRWVILGYGLTYVTITGYTISLFLRTKMARRRLEGLE